MTTVSPFPMTTATAVIVDVTKISDSEINFDVCDRNGEVIAIVPAKIAANRVVLPKMRASFDATLIRRAARAYECAYLTA
jgi:hypothetical protein